MPRNRRQLSSTRTYHIVIKGADRQLIFEEPNDFHKYLSYLEYYKELCKFEIFAYCLMPNHVHILLRHSPDCSLETIFRKLNTAYAIWFNRKYNSSLSSSRAILRSSASLDSLSPSSHIFTKQTSAATLFITVFFFII